jgi:hypothetical protein
MFLDEPLRVVILYGDRRGALKALFAIEEVKAGVAALVDPVASSPSSAIPVAVRYPARW